MELGQSPALLSLKGASNLGALHLCALIPIIPVNSQPNGMLPEWLDMSLEALLKKQSTSKYSGGRLGCGWSVRRPVGWKLTPCPCHAMSLLWEGEAGSITGSSCVAKYFNLVA